MLKEEDFINKPLKESLSEDTLKAWYNIAQDTNTNVIEDVLKERIINMVERFIVNIERRQHVQEELSELCETIYSMHLSSRFYYNPILNAFYDSVASMTGKLSMVASDDILFFVKGKTPEPLKAHFDVLWRMVKSKMKTNSWIKYQPTNEWLQKSISFVSMFVNTVAEAKMILYLVGCCINGKKDPSLTASLVSFTCIWTGGDAAKDVASFLQRLLSRLLGIHSLQTLLKFSYKSSYQWENLLFIHIQSASLRRSFAVLENHAETFLCCCARFAESNRDFHESPEIVDNLFRLRQHAQNLDKGIFEEFMLKQSICSGGNAEKHMVHFKEIQTEFHAFLEKENLPLNLIGGQESLKTVVISTLRRCEGTMYFYGTLQVPSMYGQFLTFCQECLEYVGDEDIYEEGTKDDSCHQAFRKKTMTKIYKMYKSWYQHRYHAEGEYSLTEENDLASSLLYPKVFELFAENRYGNRVVDIAVRQTYLFPEDVKVSYLVETEISECLNL